MTSLQTRLLGWYQKIRIAKFRFLSDCPNIEGKPTLRQPVQFVGKGTIRFNGEVVLGWVRRCHARRRAVTRGTASQATVLSCLVSYG